MAKLLFIMSSLLCFNAFAMDNELELDYNLSLSNHLEYEVTKIKTIGTCALITKKKIDLNKAKINRTRLLRTLEKASKCAQDIAKIKIVNICKESNNNQSPDFESLPTTKTLGCTESLMKIKGQDYVRFECKASAFAGCLTPSN